MRSTGVVLDVPLPGSPYNVIEIGIGRTPAEQSLALSRIGNQDGRVSRAARPLRNRNLYAGDFFDCQNDFADRVAAASTQVRHDRVFAGEKTIYCPNMGVSEVPDMDIVSDCRSIWRIIVRTEDLNHRQLIASCGNDEGNEVCLGDVVLADLAVRIGS